MELLADRIEAFVDDHRVAYGEVGRRLGRHLTWLRYAAPSGRILLRWDAARQPTIWTVPPLALDPDAERLELAPPVPPRLRPGHLGRVSPSGPGSRLATDGPRSTRWPGR